MTTCPCCQQETLHSFVQTFPAKYNKPDREYFECHNATCQMYMQTLTEAQYLERCKEVASK